MYCQYCATHRVYCQLCQSAQRSASARAYLSDYYAEYYAAYFTQWYATEGAVVFQQEYRASNVTAPRPRPAGGTTTARTA